MGRDAWGAMQVTPVSTHSVMSCCGYRDPKGQKQDGCFAG